VDHIEYDLFIIIHKLDLYQSQNCMEIKFMPKLSKTVLRPNNFGQQQKLQIQLEL